MLLFWKHSSLWVAAVGLKQDLCLSHLRVETRRVGRCVIRPLFNGTV